jgi:hypothetical protein
VKKITLPFKKVGVLNITAQGNLFNSSTAVFPFNPLQQELYANNFYLKENTTGLHYKDQSVI